MLKLTIVQKIITAGGTKFSDEEQESARGTVQLFEDTEGNLMGLFSRQSASPTQPESEN